MQQTKYDKIVKLSNNYIAVRKGYRWGLFDNEGTPDASFDDNQSIVLNI